jgi:hypothetical protein
MRQALLWLSIIIPVIKKAAFNYSILRFNYFASNIAFGALNKWQCLGKILNIDKARNNFCLYS